MMDLNNIDDFVRGSLDNFAEKPSEKPLQGIKKRMYLKNIFLGLKYYVLNVYTLSLLGLSIIAVTWYYYSSAPSSVTTNPSPSIAENQLPVNTIISNLNIKNETNSIQTDTINIQKPKPDERKEVAALNALQNDSKTKANKALSYENVAQNSEITQPETEINHKPEDSKRDANYKPVTNSNHVTETTQPDKKEVFKGGEPIMPTDLSSNKGSDEEKQYGVYGYDSDPEKKEQVIVPNTPEETTIETPRNENIERVVVYDTIQVFDTIQVMDTISVNKEELSNTLSDKDYFKNKYFSIDAFGETGTFSINTGGDQGAANMFDTLLDKRNFFSAGMHVNYHFNEWMISTGLSYTRFTDYLDYSKTTLNIDSTITTETIPTGGYYNYDSLFSHFEEVYEWVVDSIIIDSIPELDSTYTLVDSFAVYTPDSTWVPTDTTIEVTHYDSTKVIDTYALLNKYTYLEIPIAVSKTFGKGNLNYMVRAGLITGIFLNAKGKGVMMGSENLIRDLSELPFMRLSFSGLLGAGVSYKLTDNWRLLLEANYRKQLNTLFTKDYPINVRRNGLGIKAGVRINL